MNITIFTIAFNEEFQIKYFIDHYRSRFPKCEIVVYDNMSTDNTKQICLDNNCAVIGYDTNNTIMDSKYLEIKNNCWKNAKTDFVCIVDVDEILDISESDLIEEEKLETSIISFNGFNMINLEDNCDLYNINHGVREINYDKKYLFNKKFIQEINYLPGCHRAIPTGKIKLSDKQYNAYHFNFINVDMSVEKYKLYATRLSEENKSKGWGLHYLMNKEQVTNEFNSLRKKAVKLF